MPSSRSTSPSASRTTAPGCDLEARRYLRAPRASSVFPAPVRAALAGGTYLEVCNAHHHADGRRISRQAFSILPKIKEVDEVLSHRPALQGRIREIHPEVCFAVWNGGRAMRHRKSSPTGRAERESLIDAVWPGERERLRGEIRRLGCERRHVINVLLSQPAGSVWKRAKCS